MADDTKGKIKETVGWATGDRRVEAEGRVEAADGDSDDEEQVKAAEKQVRIEEGDVVPPDRDR
jgi:uncharacterized protein YjbJ (UPF0337 family)